MEVAFTALCQKSVVSIKDGKDFGAICDIVIDVHNSRLCAIVMPGRPRFFGLLGRQPDTVIPVSEIKSIGKDVILVDYMQKEPENSQNKGFFDRFF